MPAPGWRLDAGIQAREGMRIADGVQMAHVPCSLPRGFREGAPRSVHPPVPAGRRGGRGWRVEEREEAHHSNIGHIFISHHALNAEAAARVPWVYASRKYERPVLQFEWRHMTVLWLHAWILTRRMRASTNLADLVLYSFVKLYMGRRGI